MPSGKAEERPAAGLAVQAFALALSLKILALGAGARARSIYLWTPKVHERIACVCWLLLLAFFAVLFVPVNCFFWGLGHCLAYFLVSS